MLSSKKTTLDLRKTPVYGNIGVLHPEGHLMFYGNDDKAEWYLSRNLATWVSTDPPLIQLSFIPNGSGHQGDDFYLQHRENICVVCGVTEDLTRHHVVPHGFRRFFPDNLKNYSSYDILPMCWICHHAYEQKANELKTFLAKKYNIEYSGEFVIEHQKHLNQIHFQSYLRQLERNPFLPEERRIEMQNAVEEFLQTNGMTEDELKKIPRRKRFTDDTFGYRLVQNFQTTEDFQKFMVLWRTHFIENTNPQHLPKNWRVDRVEKYHV